MGYTELSVHSVREAVATALTSYNIVLLERVLTKVHTVLERVLTKVHTVP